MSTGSISRAQRRITKDIKDIFEDPKNLSDSNIHIWFNEENMYTIYILMIGTDGTPYTGGFYFFKFIFTDEYPIKPPTAKFYSTDGKIRFNPNLYTCGKVCLSLLGTWSGPQWTPANSLTSILVSLQAMVLNKNPLINEPGYDSSPTETLEKYNAVIRHENLRFAVNKLLDKVPVGFECFYNVMENYFLENFNKYLNTVKELREKEDNKTIESPAYGMKIVTNYKKIYNDIVIKFNKIVKEYLKTEINVDEMSDANIEIIINDILTKKKNKGLNENVSSNPNTAGETSGTSCDIDYSKIVDKICELHIDQLRYVSKFNLIEYGTKKSTDGDEAFTLKEEILALVNNKTFDVASLDGIDNILEEVD